MVHAISPERVSSTCVNEPFRSQVLDYSLHSPARANVVVSHNQLHPALPRAPALPHGALSLIFINILVIQPPAPTTKQPSIQQLRAIDIDVLA